MQASGHAFFPLLVEELKTTINDGQTPGTSHQSLFETIRSIPLEVAFIQRNLAHALLFQSHVDKALVIYDGDLEQSTQWKTSASVSEPHLRRFPFHVY